MVLRFEGTQVSCDCVIAICHDLSSHAITFAQIDIGTGRAEMHKWNSNTASLAFISCHQTNAVHWAMHRHKPRERMSWMDIPIIPIIPPLWITYIYILYLWWSLIAIGRSCDFVWVPVARYWRRWPPCRHCKRLQSVGWRLIWLIWKEGSSQCQICVHGRSKQSWLPKNDRVHVIQESRPDFFLIFLVLALSIPIAWDTMKIPNLRLFVRWPAGGVPIHVQGYRWLQVPRGGRQGATDSNVPPSSTIKLYTVVYCTWFIFIWDYHPPTKHTIPPLNTLNRACMGVPLPRSFGTRIQWWWDVHSPQITNPIIRSPSPESSQWCGNSLLNRSFKRGV